ncbi:hypothetical protein BDQ17DRAFT_1367511 [Cyathus striatus]|nr:hypothetical protein BDQ17DRAFT_1367511 [Cyathus striatus]
MAEPERCGLKSLTIIDLRPTLIQPLLDALSNPECKLEKLVLKSYMLHNYGKMKNSLVTLECVAPRTTTDFDDSYDATDAPWKIDISVLPHLRTLKFFIDFEFEDPFENGNEIQDVIFELTYTNFSELVKSNQWDWEQLDALFCKSNIVESVDLLLGSFLPALRGKGLLLVYI